MLNKMNGISERKVIKTYIGKFYLQFQTVFVTIENC